MKHQGVIAAKTTKFMQQVLSQENKGTGKQLEYSRLIENESFGALPRVQKTQATIHRDDNQ